MTIEAHIRSGRMTRAAFARTQNRVRAATRRAFPDHTITTS